MKRDLLLNGNPLAFTVSANSGSQVVSFDGQEHVLEITESEPGVLVIRDNGVAFPARVVRAKDVIHVWLNGRTFEFSIPTSDSDSAGGTESSKDEIHAPMPGTLIKLSVKAGDAVEEGQTVAVVEAMKMEHNLRASRAGVVDKTSGTVGQIVDTETAIVSLVKED